MSLAKSIILFLYLLSFQVYSQQAIEDENYQKGKYYALKYKYDLALPYLKKSADTGNENAMLRYAFLVNVQHGLFLNLEAFEYVEKSAENGNEWAMSLLADHKYSGLRKTESAKWTKQLNAKLAPYLEKNDKDALHFMSHVEFDDKYEKWLEKASEAGSGEAMVKLADYYLNNGWFILPGSREKKIKELRDAAFKLGNSQAILTIGAQLIAKGDVQQGERDWNRLIDRGDAEAIIDIARYYSKQDEFPEIYNLEKSARLMKVYLDSMGRDGIHNMYDYFEEKYPEIYSSLTPEQQANVDKWVKDYLATHDVLAPDTMWETKFK
jgi:TPR repeat protein